MLFIFVIPLTTTIRLIINWCVFNVIFLHLVIGGLFIVKILVIRLCDFIISNLLIMNALNLTHYIF